MVDVAPGMNGSGGGLRPVRSLTWRCSTRLCLSSSSSFYHLFFHDAIIPFFVLSWGPFCHSDCDNERAVLDFMVVLLG